MSVAAPALVSFGPEDHWQFQHGDLHQPSYQPVSKSSTPILLKQSKVASQSSFLYAQSAVAVCGIQYVKGQAIDLH